MTTLYNPKNGDTFTSALSVSEVVECLKGMKKNNFAQSLAFNTVWSEGQKFWAYKLAEEGVPERKEVKAYDVGEGFYKKVSGWLLKSGLQRPKVRTKDFTISFGARGIYVCLPDGEYLGKITPEDVFIPRKDNSYDQLVGRLKEFAPSPLLFVVQYGRDTGQCSFCGRELINEESVSHGYGPICADKFGLPYDHSKNPVC